MRLPPAIRGAMGVTASCNLHCVVSQQAPGCGLLPFTPPCHSLPTAPCSPCNQPTLRIDVTQLAAGPVQGCSTHPRRCTAPGRLYAGPGDPAASQGPTQAPKKETIGASGPWRALGIAAAAARPSAAAAACPLAWPGYLPARHSLTRLTSLPFPLLYRYPRLAAEHGCRVVRYRRSPMARRHQQGQLLHHLARADPAPALLPLPRWHQPLTWPPASSGCCPGRRAAA